MSTVAASGGLTLRGLVKRYGAVQAVAGIDLEIRRGEFLTLLGTFANNTWVAFFATSGVILSACYALWLYRRVVFGKLEKSSLSWMPDMTPRELMTLAPLLVLTLFFGVYPAPILDTVAASVENLLKTVQVAAAHLDTITLTMK